MGNSKYNYEITIKITKWCPNGYKNIHVGFIQINVYQNKSQVARELYKPH